jgi:hypothetical protein
MGGCPPVKKGQNTCFQYMQILLNTKHTDTLWNLLL